MYCFKVLPHEISPADSNSLVTCTVGPCVLLKVCKPASIAKTNSLPHTASEYSAYSVHSTPLDHSLNSAMLTQIINNFLSQNTPKRCILHSNTHSNLIIKSSSQKSRNLFNLSHNFILPPSSSCLVVLSLYLHTVKNHTLSSAKNPFYFNQNISKTPHC